MKSGATFFDCKGKEWKGLSVSHRRILMVLALVEVFYCLYIFNTEAIFPLYSQIFLIGAGVFSLYVSIRGTVQYVTPIVLSLFYLLGYPLYLASIILNEDKYTKGGWMAIGNFDFGSENFTELSVASGVLMLGLLVGCRLVQSRVSTIKLVQERHVDISRNTLQQWITIWFLMSMALILFLAIYGLGRTGLQDETALPYGIKGVLYYVRLMIVPIIGAFLLQQAANSLDWKNLARVLICSFIIAGAVAIFAFSRSDPVIILLPLIVYLLMHQNAQLRRTASRAMVPCVIGIILMTQIVAVLRDYAYSTEGLSSKDVDNVAKQIQDVTLNDIGDNLLMLLTIRQGGSRDMAVVMTSPYQDISYVWRFFMQIDEMDFMTDVWGFETGQLEQEGTSYGTGFNGFAWYYFGRSLLFLFILSVLTGAFLIWVEDVFLKRGWRVVQIWVGFFMSLMFWNSFVWGRVWRVLPMLFVAYFIMEYLASKKVSHSSMALDTHRHTHA